MGPINVDGNAADPVGNSASGDRTLDLLTKGDVSPPATPGRMIDSSTGGATSVSDALWDNVLGMGPDDVVGNIADSVGDGASDDHTLGLLVKGDVSPPA